MNFRWVVFTAAALALSILSVAASGAHAGGNSDAAKLCQQDGWMELQTAGGEPFETQGECVAYAAKGGALSSKPAPSLVFTIEQCVPPPGGYTCPGTLVGSGLQPGGIVYLCTDGPGFNRPFCAPQLYIEADGTVSTSGMFGCGEGLVHEYSAPARDGTIIFASDSC